VAVYGIEARQPGLAPESAVDGGRHCRDGHEPGVGAPRPTSSPSASARRPKSRCVVRYSDQRAHRQGFESRLLGWRPIWNDGAVSHSGG
jgi:hypothetical protein